MPSRGLWNEMTFSGIEHPDIGETISTCASYWGDKFRLHPCVYLHCEILVSRPNEETFRYQHGRENPEAAFFMEAPFRLHRPDAPFEVVFIMPARKYLQLIDDKLQAIHEYLERR